MIVVSQEMKKYFVHVQVRHILRHRCVSLSNLCVSNRSNPFCCCYRSANRHTGTGQWRPDHSSATTLPLSSRCAKRRPSVTPTFPPLGTLLFLLPSQAYAKFFGSYAALETGHVHHALTAFTGAQSEEIFLAGAGRGVGKKSLWKKMIK